MPTVKATELVQDYDLYPRAQVDGYHVREIAEALEAGVSMPPVIAEKGTKRVVDGFHRIRAAQKIHGATAKIEVVFKVYGSEAELFREAMRLNADHGRNLCLLYTSDAADE